MAEVGDASPQQSRPHYMQPSEFTLFGDYTMTAGQRDSAIIVCQALTLSLSTPLKLVEARGKLKVALFCS